MASRAGKKRQDKLIGVPVRLGVAEFAAMSELARLSGYPVNVVTSVCVAIGYLKTVGALARGLAAHKAKGRRRG